MRLPTILLSSLAVLSVLFSLSPSALAADLPAVHVTKLSLTQASFQPGDTASGTFVLKNSSAENAPQVLYVVRVVGAYDKNGLPAETYSAKTFGPVFLGGNQEKQIEFDIQIPDALPSNDVGIEVQAMLTSGAPLGWSDVHIALHGNAAPKLVLSNAAVIVNSIFYSLEAGPTIHEGQQAALGVLVRNNTSSAVPLSASLEVYDRSASTGRLLGTFPQASFDALAGTTTDERFPLPDFNRTPGVYEGRLSFLPASGNTPIPPLTFRYIVSGPAATIQSVSSDRGDAAAGDVVNVIVAYTGAPPDINPEGRTPTALDGASLLVKLVGEKEQAVSSGTLQIAFDGTPSVTLPLTALHPASALLADVSIVKDGKVLAEKRVPLSSQYDQLHQAPLQLTGWMIAVLVVVAAVIVFAVLFLFRRRPRLPPAALLMLLAVGIGISAILPAGSEAFTKTSNDWTPPQPESATPYSVPQCFGDWWGDFCFESGTPATHLGVYWPAPPGLNQNISNVYVTTQIFLNSPDETLAPGQTFYIEGSIISMECINSVQDLYVEAEFQGSKAAFYRSDPPGHGYYFPNDGHISTATDRFRFGPFTAPQEPGTYRVNVNGAWFVNSGGGAYYTNPQGGAITGYQEFSVPDALLPINTTPANPAGGTGGSGEAGTEGTGGNGNGNGSDQCHDAIDNNGDNLIDANDPGCKGGFGKEGIPDASLKLVPDKNPVQKNQIVTFSYLVENIVSGLCKLSGNNGDSFALSGNAGSQKTSPIQNETKFTLVCQALKDKANVSTSVTIKVAPNFNEF